jgi:hypothetical protein
MTHFDITQWTDFARGVIPEQDRAAMEAHRAAGCRQCESTLSLVNQVAASMRADAASPVPADAVRWVKALASMQTPSRSRLSRIVAELVFDSRLAPAAVGVRGDDQAAHHMVYAAGAFDLALRVEQEPGAAAVTLVGQLTNREEPQAPVAKAPVLVMARTAVVAHTLSNRFGEFQVEYPPTPRLRLCVTVDPAFRRIELPLDRLTADASGRKSSPRPGGRGTSRGSRDSGR